MVLAKMVVGAVLILTYVNVVNKKQVSQMTSLDFLGNLILGYIIGDGVTSSEVKLIDYSIIILIGIGVIALLNFISRKIDWLRKPILGKSLPLVKNGRFMISNFADNKSQMDLLDLVTALRGQKIFTFSGIKYIQIENNGEVTALKETEDDLSFIVFNNGTILKDGLARLGKDEEWLRVELAKERISSIEEIFAIEGTKRGLFIIKNDGTTTQTY